MCRTDKKARNCTISLPTTKWLTEAEKIEYVKMS